MILTEIRKIFDKYILDDNIIGIGTGKTMRQFAKNLPNDKKYVPTSLQAELFLENKPIISSMNCSHIDIYFDSADYYNDRGDLIKGGGGALTQEKLLMGISTKAVIMVQKKKHVSNFEGLMIPLEIIRPSYGYVSALLDTLGFRHELRKVDNSTIFLTDLGNLIIDVEYNKEFLKNCTGITGVVEHGYFENNGKTIIEEINDFENE